MRVRLIVNPQGGRRTGATAGRMAADILRGGGWQVEVAPTEAPGHAAELARTAASEGCDLVVGVGGDGTLSEMLNGLVGTGIACGIIPCGTGNDFARFVGISCDVNQATRQILNGSPTPVDLGHLVSHSRYFINTVGVGFDARVTERINRRRRISRGLVAYVPAIVAELLRHSPLPALVEVDGQRFEDEWLLVAVANGNAYGGGLKIAPQARCDDGLLDVVLVQHTGRLDVLRSLRLVMRGEHERHPKVRMLRTHHVTIQTETPTPALVDGDVLAETPLEIEIAPAGALLWK